GRQPARDLRGRGGEALARCGQQPPGRRAALDVRRGRVRPLRGRECGLCLQGGVQPRAAAAGVARGDGLTVADPGRRAPTAPPRPAPPGAPPPPRPPPQASIRSPTATRSNSRRSTPDTDTTRSSDICVSVTVRLEVPCDSASTEQ